MSNNERKETKKKLKKFFFKKWGQRKWMKIDVFEKCSSKTIKKRFLSHRIETELNASEFGN